jgi:hypothetical protein
MPMAKSSLKMSLLSQKMKFNRIIKIQATILFTSLAFSAIASAQDRAIGPFAFANALDSEKPTFVYLNGDAYKPKGYLSGQMTYGGRTWAGQVNLVAENEELGRSSIAIKITPDTAPIVIAYAHERELEDGTIKRELKLRAIQPDPSRKNNLSGLYAADTGNATLLVNRNKYLLEPFKLTTVAPQNVMAFKPQNSQQAPIELSFETPMSFIAIIYNLKNGYQSAMAFRDLSGETSKD